MNCKLVHYGTFIQLLDVKNEKPAEKYIVKK